MRGRDLASSKDVRMIDHGNLAEVARRAVAEACAVCRQVQAALDEVRAITKDDKSPVTVADFACQAIIAKSLREALGNNVILVAEETSHFLRDEDHAPHLDATIAAVKDFWSDVTEAKLLDAIDAGAGDTKHAAFWTLDPVDGTKGFLRGQQYAIALAFIENGEPVVGALGCPNLPRDFSAPLDEPDAEGCLYYAARGLGLFETTADASAEPIRIRRLDPAKNQPISVCESVESGHSRQDDTTRILEKLGPTREPTRLDSQCKYAVVARGQADAYLRMPTKQDYVERIWDHAAGSLIAAEAGAYTTDITGRDLDFFQGRGLEKNRGIVCAPPAVHGRILAAIRDLGLA